MDQPENPNPASLPSKYCDFHRCGHPHEPCYACRRGAAFAYCPMHTCKVCNGGPVLEAPPRNTCEAHPLCAQILGKVRRWPAWKCVDAPASAHIQAHQPLRFPTIKGNLCCELVAPPSVYCARHEEPHLAAEAAAAAAAAGKAKAQAKGQAKAAGPGAGIVGSEICSGATKKGAKCKSRGVVSLGGRPWCDAHKVHRWPAWNCSCPPYGVSHPGTSTSSVLHMAQVHRWPAWKCVAWVEGRSHPGTLTPPNLVRRPQGPVPPRP